jgi:hypothetical protein
VLEVWGKVEGLIRFSLESAALVWPSQERWLDVAHDFKDHDLYTRAA